jgi:hypothetical protein
MPRTLTAQGRQHGFCTRGLHARQGLDRVRRHVRRGHHIGQLHRRQIPDGLLREHIEPGAGQAALAKRPQEGVLVHDGPPAGGDCAQRETQRRRGRSIRLRVVRQQPRRGGPRRGRWPQTDDARRLAPHVGRRDAVPPPGPSPNGRIRPPFAPRPRPRNHGRRLAARSPAAVARRRGPPRVCSVPAMSQTWRLPSMCTSMPACGQRSRRRRCLTRRRVRGLRRPAAVRSRWSVGRESTRPSRSARSSLRCWKLTRA